MPAKRSDEEARAFFISKGLVPLEPYPGQSTPWKSRCKNCKQIVPPHFSSIKAGRGCGVCSGLVVIPEMAIKVRRAAGFIPQVPYPGAKTAWKCGCTKCGRTVSPPYSAIARGGQGGCKFCATSGIDYQAPAFI